MCEFTGGQAGIHLMLQDQTPPESAAEQFPVLLTAITAESISVVTLGMVHPSANISGQSSGQRAQGGAADFPSV